MADYVTSSEVADFAHEFTSNATASDLLVTSASRLFDNLTEVPENFFAPAPSPVSYTTRDFYGDGTAYLKLDPFTALNTVTPIVIDPAFVYDLPDYETDIKNFQLIDLSRTKRQSAENFSMLDRYTGWERAIKVTVSANWGWSETPADVKMATIHLAIHLWRTVDPAFATISNAEGAASRPRTLPQIAQVTIDRYKEKFSRRFVFA